MYRQNLYRAGSNGRRSSANRYNRNYNHQKVEKEGGRNIECWDYDAVKDRKKEVKKQRSSKGLEKGRKILHVKSDKNIRFDKRELDTEDSEVNYSDYKDLAKMLLRTMESREVDQKTKKACADKLYEIIVKMAAYGRPLKFDNLNFDRFLPNKVEKPHKQMYVRKHSANNSNRGWFPSTVDTETEEPVYQKRGKSANNNIKSYLRGYQTPRQLKKYSVYYPDDDTVTNNSTNNSISSASSYQFSSIADNTTQNSSASEAPEESAAESAGDSASPAATDQESSSTEGEEKKEDEAAKEGTTDGEDSTKKDDAEETAADSTEEAEEEEETSASSEGAKDETVAENEEEEAKSDESGDKTAAEETTEANKEAGDASANCSKKRSSLTETLRRLSRRLSLRA